MSTKYLASMKPNNNFTIKDWALEDRPREKLLSKGTSSLSNTELLSILIGTGTRRDSAVDLSKKILKSVKNNLNELGKLSFKQFTTIKGIGPAKAVTIIAALELGRRRKVSEGIEKKKIAGSHDVFEVFQPFLGDLPHEEFWVCLLNRSNKIIESIRISQGGISGTIIDVRLILKNAIDYFASAIILCHNHPSGNLKPSDADIKITRKINDSSQIMDIRLLDHVIVADNSYFSFADEGLI